MTLAGDRVTFDIGPLPSTAARAGIEHALVELKHYRHGRNAMPFLLPPEIADRFEDYLLAWQELADEGDTFRLSCEVDVAVTRFLLTYWLNMICLRPSQRDALGIPDRPADGDMFSRALGRAILGAIARHGELHPFADFIRNRRRLRGGRHE
jgi:hypothetical protein